MPDSKIPKSRAASLFSMAAKVALKEGKTLIRNQAEARLNKMVEQADVVVKHVGRLKGAAMKAVQMITIEAQDFLPPEVLEVLEKLQSQAPPLENKYMINLIKKELGEENFKKLANLSDRPIAAASIGQVYEAEIEGQPVVIKVQYPGIAESVDSDLKTVKKLVKTLLFLYKKQIDIDDLFIEINRVLKLETDYLREVKNLKLYKEKFSSYSEYIVPEAYEELSTRRVIVMSKMEGLELTDWLKTSPNEERRFKVGTLLLDLYNIEFMKNQLVQTDPNPANFLINKEDKLVLLDFGATVEFPEEFVKNYANLLASVFQGEDKEIGEVLEKFNFISPKEEQKTKDLFIDFMKYSMRPFKAEEQPFDFTSVSYSEEVRKRVLLFTKSIKYSAPPKQIIFLHRKLGGVFNLAKKLEVKADLTKYQKYFLEDS